MTSLHHTNRRVLVGAGLAAGGLAAWPLAASAETAAQITQKAHAALDHLYATRASAKALGDKAQAVLVFPEIVKAGAVVGGQAGNGAVFVKGKVAGFYRISAASVGLQLGVQKFGYALFLMTPKAVDYLRSSNGWAIGTGPSVVIADEGFLKSANTTTLKKDVVAMAFSQKGLMAGAGLEGSKISKIAPT